MRLPALALALVASAIAGAQIVLKPSGQDAIELTPKTVDVNAKLQGGVANSLWTYTFANAERFRGQADFLIAIPKGGVVGGFAYWYQGEKVIARITEKERAKQIYSAIVARQRDPALIEMVGKNTFRVRIFPIDPDTDLKVEIQIIQAIPAGPTGSTLSIPLHSLGKLEKATVEVSGEGKVQTSWGGPNYTIQNSKVPDLKVSQTWAPTQLHASLLAARSGGPTGFFVLTLATPTLPKNPKWKLDGPVEEVSEVRRTATSLVLTGRYRTAGALRATLSGQTVSLSLSLIHI